MFTTPCFIRKNTPELRKKLEELEYIISDTLVITNFDEIICYDNIAYGCEYPCEYRQKAIDCGVNEDMFLALAALRDDSNEHQWFIAQDTMWDENYNGEITVEYKEGEWLIWDYYSFMIDEPSYFRKATVEEIIEHFNKK